MLGDIYCRCRATPYGTKSLTGELFYRQVSVFAAFSDTPLEHLITPHQGLWTITFRMRVSRPATIWVRYVPVKTCSPDWFRPSQSHCWSPGWTSASFTFRTSSPARL